MRDFIITTDSTSDLPDGYIKENSLDILPLFYNIDGTVYGGDIKLDTKEFYEKMRTGLMPTTMACNPEDAESSFRKHLEKDLDILHIGFSSALSSSYDTVAIVGRQLQEEYPDSKIIVLDSLCASMGEGLLVHKAIQLKKEGKNINEIANWIEDNKIHICHQFTVDDLNHLHRGGRVSKKVAVIGSLINVKPVLHVDNEGRLTPLMNVRGRKKSLTTLVDNMEQAGKGFEEQNNIIFISHGDCLEDAQTVASMITERFGIKDILINYVGPTIGTHSGPGTVALFFMGNAR